MRGNLMTFEELRQRMEESKIEKQIEEEGGEILRLVDFMDEPAKKCHEAICSFIEDCAAVDKEQATKLGHGYTLVLSNLSQNILNYGYKKGVKHAIEQMNQY